MSHTIGQDQQDDRQSNTNLSQGARDSPKPQSHTFKSHTALSDADYEFLFNQLLEGITHGWHDRRIIKFFQQLGDRGKQEDWITWLDRIGPKLVKLPIQSKHQLGMLMIRLGELTRSAVEVAQISATCDHWGRKLVLGDKPTAVWEYVGPDLALTQTQNTEKPESDERSSANSDTLGSPLEEDFQESVAQQSITDLGRAVANAFDLNIEHQIEELPSQLQAESYVEDRPPRKLSGDNLVEPNSLADSTDFAESDRGNLESETSDSILKDDSSTRLHEQERILSDTNVQPSSDLPLAATEGELEMVRMGEAAADKTPASLWDEDPEAIDMQQVMSLIQEDRELARQILQKLNPSSTPPNLNPTTSKEADAPNSELIESWFNLGLKQVSAGELEQAIASWEKALNINPNLSEAWHNRGSALGRLGNYEAAIESFQNALSINPDNYQAWNDRAHALYQLQNWSEAADSWSNALKIMPGNHLFWYNRGCALEQLERWSEAIASYEKALEIRPDFQLGRARYINLVADNSRSD